MLRIAVRFRHNKTEATLNNIMTDRLYAAPDLVPIYASRNSITGAQHLRRAITMHRQNQAPLDRGQRSMICFSLLCSLPSTLFQNQKQPASTALPPINV